ncbi:MAG: hypothetical protein PHV16_00610 [Candidatus Nanoarchaeia archaeon]|nr:hypothetical protein [Candidatus Nanoarchaeia archaeon]
MDKFEQLKENLVNSFRLAKTDIIETKQDVISISRTQESIIETISQIKEEQARLVEKVKVLEKKAAEEKKEKVVVKSNGKRAQKIFVAPKNGSLFHEKNCPFAQNIKPKNKLTFKSKVKALNEGFKPCKCIK